MSTESRMDALISFQTEPLEVFAKKFKDVLIEDGKIVDAEYVVVDKKRKQLTCKIKR